MKMKKFFRLVVVLICMITLVGCTQAVVHTDYPAAIMVDDMIYYQTMDIVEINEDSIIGYTSSYTDTYPDENGETNFNRELDMPYAQVENGIAVFYENKWHLCTPVEEGNTEPEQEVTVQAKVEWIS